MARDAQRNPARIVIHGTGRMARSIDAAAAGAADLTVIALVGPQPPEWETAAAWFKDLHELTAAAIPQPGLEPDLLIDFTLPDGTLAAARWCRERAVPLLSGVTGLPADTLEALRETARGAPVLWSPNLSLGVNLLADLAARAAAVLDPGAPVLIEDIHHQWKKDAPSGTALMLGETIAAQRGGASAIEYRSLRQGEVVGEHTVRFRLAGEELDLVHRAQDRSIFAGGALDAGRWLLRQPPGFYSARDWLAGR
ncbi:MAG: 4-hydroxy-tetrahydrodipicolinate reductase [Xanthomonadales bacterium]|jgi:4-hydroxy-tetrahydrodipicolinate reductase|nr:4-hydroxy-tetrahydrodipicolinate reductase [Xanthomonadales bacterium]